jgi:hypothetical protein
MEQQQQQQQQLCDYCGDQPATGVCKQCETVAWCGEECRHAHWNEGHADECEIIGNPYHVANLEQVGEFCEAYQTDLLADAMDLALLEASANDFVQESFLEAGNEIANELAALNDGEAVPIELSDAAVTWLQLHELGPDASLVLKTPEEILFQLHEEIGSALSQYSAYVAEREEHALVANQISESNLYSKYVSLESFYASAVDEYAERGSLLSPETIATALDLIEASAKAKSKKRVAQHRRAQTSHANKAAHHEGMAKHHEKANNPAKVEHHQREAKKHNTLARQHGNAAEYHEGGTAKRPVKHSPAAQHAGPVKHSPAGPVKHASAAQHAGPVKHSPPVKQRAPAKAVFHRQPAARPPAKTAPSIKRPGVKREETQAERNQERQKKKRPNRAPPKIPSAARPPEKKAEITRVSEEKKKQQQQPGPAEERKKPGATRPVEERKKTPEPTQKKEPLPRRKRDEQPMSRKERDGERQSRQERIVRHGPTIIFNRGQGAFQGFQGGQSGFQGGQNGFQGGFQQGGVQPTPVIVTPATATPPPPSPQVIVVTPTTPAAPATTTTVVVPPFDPDREALATATKALADAQIALGRLKQSGTATPAEISAAKIRRDEAQKTLDAMTPQPDVVLTAD